MSKTKLTRSSVRGFGYLVVIFLAFGLIVLGVWELSSAWGKVVLGVLGLLLMICFDLADRRPGERGDVLDRREER